MYILWLRNLADERFTGQQGVAANPDMTGQDLAQTAFQMWNMQPKPCRLIRIHPDGNREIDLSKTLRENGVRNGDPIDFTVA